MALALKLTKECHKENSLYWFLQQFSVAFRWNQDYGRLHGEILTCVSADWSLEIISLSVIGKTIFLTENLTDLR